MTNHAPAIQADFKSYLRSEDDIWTQACDYSQRAYVAKCFIEQWARTHMDHDDAWTFLDQNFWHSSILKDLVRALELAQDDILERKMGRYL